MTNFKDTFDKARAAVADRHTHGTFTSDEYTALLEQAEACERQRQGLSDALAKANDDVMLLGERIRELQGNRGEDLSIDQAADNAPTDDERGADASIAQAEDGDSEPSTT